MRRILVSVLTCAICLGGSVTLAGSASAKPQSCPSAYELSDLSELEAFVIAAGGEIGTELTGFFEIVDENDDGLICFKTLPEATPYPTPPLLAGDNKLPKASLIT